jgi:hypothetical protein
MIDIDDNTSSTQRESLAMECEAESWGIAINSTMLRRPVDRPFCCCQKFVKSLLKCPDDLVSNMKLSG